MFISIDAGGTNTRIAGALELNDPTFVSDPLRRRNAHDFDNDITFMVSAALQIADGRPIEAVGIGLPGLPNEGKTAIKSAKNLPSWAGKPLVASLSEGLGGCPVFYDTDVTAAGLGEAYYGQTEGEFDYIIWGTGIGGGGIHREDGKPRVDVLHWQTHFADWESSTGGAELQKRFGKAPEAFTAADWEVVAQDFRRNVARYLSVRRPQVIAFGGGLAVRHVDMIQEVGRDLGVRLAVTKFGDDSGLMGGFGLIRSGLHA